MKKIISTILAFSLILSLCVPAMAATVDELKSDTVLTEGTVGERNGVFVEWKVSTGTAAIVTANISYAYDMNVFELVDSTGAAVTAPTGEPPVQNLAQLVGGDSAIWNFANDLYFKQSENTGLVAFIRSSITSQLQASEMTTLGKFFLAYKTGKSIADVTTSAVRMATAAEADALGQSSVVGMGDSTYVEYKYGTIDGSDTAGWGDNLTFAKDFPFAKPALPSGGSVTLSGTAKYGETLIATASGLPSDAGALTFNWYRSGETDAIQSGDSYTYLINSADDVNKTITVEVTTANYSGALTATSAGVVKADGGTAPGAPTLKEKNATSVTLDKLDGYEYSKDKAAWQTSNEFTGLPPNTKYSFYLRVAETATRYASAASTALEVTTDKATAGDELKASLKAAVTAYVGDYDGAAHDAFTPGTLPTGWTVSGYSDSETGTFSTAMPKVTNVADSKTLYVKFTNASYSDVVIGYAVTVNAKNISGAEITLGTQKTYNGSAQYVVISSVKVGGKTLTKEVDYMTKSGDSAATVTETTLTIEGKGNYTGTATTTWSLQAKPVAATMIEAIGNQTYTGSALTPALSVKDGAAPLTSADYTATYSNNTYVGTATATITGKGNYTGTASKTFQITPAAQTPTFTTPATLAKGGNMLDLSTLVQNVKGSAAVSFSIASGDAATLSGSVLTSDVTKTGD